MGDRGNILVKENDNDSGVYLYTHWTGSYIGNFLQEALSKKQRWDDCAYLTRIIFDTMTRDHHGKTDGFGISTFECDNNHPTLVVNVEKKTVDDGNNVFTFKEYLLIG